MSPGKRGDKDAESNGNAKPPKRDTQANPPAGATPQKGPSTDTIPPGQQPNRTRRRLSGARKPGATPATKPAGAEKLRSRRRSVDPPTDKSGAKSIYDRAKTAGVESSEALPPEAEAEDAWAEYEEDANDWVLTDEQVVAAPGNPTTHSGTTGELRKAGTFAVPVGALADFNPAEHAVPTGFEAPNGAGSWLGLTGHDAGQSWPLPPTALGAGRIRLGRGVDNDVVLGDPSISRHHAELQRRAGVWEIADMQSGNGTFVAGQRTPRARFMPGDVLGLGSATYRLVLPDAAGGMEAPGHKAMSGAAGAAGAPALAAHSAAASALAPTGQPPGATSVTFPARTWAVPQAVRQAPRWVQGLLLVATGGASLLVAAGGWHMLRVWDIVGPLHTAIFEHYIEGVEALTGHRWDDAERAFRSVLEADPNSGRGKAYLHAAGVGREDAQELEKAQRALAAGDLIHAYAATGRLEDGLFHAEGRALRQSVVVHMTQRLDRAHQALEAGHLQEAQDLLSEVQSTIPDRADVALLRSRADASLGTLASGAPARPAFAPSANRVPKTTKRRTKPLTGPLGEAVKDFNDANPDAALAKMEAIGGEQARQMAQAVRTFMHTYETGLAEHRGKRAFNAIQALTQAKSQEAQIGGGAGKLAGMIDSKLADMYYVIGMQAYARHSWSEAAEAWRQAIERVPQHALSRRKLEELDEKAKALMDEANSIKAQDTEKARSLLRQVLQIVPSNSDVGKRAKRLSATLR